MAIEGTCVQGRGNSQCKDLRQEHAEGVWGTAGRPAGSKWGWAAAKTRSGGSNEASCSKHSDCGVWAEEWHGQTVLKGSRWLPCSRGAGCRAQVNKRSSEGSKDSSEEAPAVTQPRNVGGLGQGGSHGERGLDSRPRPKIEQKNYLEDWIWGLKEGEWLRMCARF